MAKNNKRSPFRSKIAIFGIILLLVGIAFALSQVQTIQNIRQQAAGKPVGSSNTQSFESSLGGWVFDQYPALSGKIDRSPQYTKENKDYKAYRGKQSLIASLNGLNQDATVWMERKVSVKPDSLVNIDISFYLWNQPMSEAGSWPVFAYADLNDPETRTDFGLPIGQTDTSANWKEHTYSKTFKTDSTGKAWVAFGIGAITPETRTYYMDFVKVKITPISVSKPEAIAPEPTIPPCGGIAAIPCPNGYKCYKKDPSIPDSTGICVSKYPKKVVN